MTLVRRIAKVISQPHTIPAKVAARREIFRLARLKKDYDFSFFDDAQDKKFQELGLNRKQGERILATLYEKMPELSTMKSEHHNLFASYAQKSPPRTILEIGTYSGAGTKLLSALFPNAEITSIDLRDDDPIFVSSYHREKNEDRLKFIEKRNAVLNTCGNVKFQQMNSLELIHFNDRKFDFIWIDGAHGYPVVTADIINSIRLLNENGTVMIDDVWDTVDKNDGMYKSIAAYETLKHLVDAEIISFDLVCKRITFPKAFIPYRKYIAVVMHGKKPRA